MAATTTAGEDLRTPRTRAAGDGHLWQVDIVRLAAFSGVIAVHSVAWTHPAGDAVAAGFIYALQFGREVFFALTGFVLVYSGRRRPLPVRRFWRRRFPLVLAPYATWTAIYWGYSHGAAGGLGGYLWDLVSGQAEYHLYFLLVTFQLYLVWPLISRFVERTAGQWKHWLVGVGVLNLGWMAVLEYMAYPGGAAGTFLHTSYELLPTYIVYVLAGCYAAAHLDRLHLWLDRNGPLLTRLCGAGLVLGVGVYVAELPVMSLQGADSPLQPSMMVMSFAVMGLLYHLGRRWSQGRRRLLGAVQVGGDISFGVYLAHPLIIAALAAHGLGLGDQILPSWPATVLMFAGAATGASILSYAARRSPLSLALTGRPRPRRPSQAGSDRAGPSQADLARPGDVAEPADTA